MYDQFTAGLFQLNHCFIRIHHLFQKNGIPADMDEGMTIVIIRKYCCQFFNAQVAMQGGTYKNPPCKIASPGNKTQIDTIARL